MTTAGVPEFQGTARFQLIRRLGAGGMGVVYEALDRERNCRVALKTVRDLGGEDLLRLKNEFRALQDLQHPNLVSLGELLEEGGRWFFTMELIEGVSFIDYVRPDHARTAGARGRTDQDVSPSADTWSASPAQKLWAGGGTLDESRLRAALAQLARGLAAAHAGGMIHRDIKPSNILVTGSGRVVLLDFGLVTGIAPGDQSMAMHAVGTADYMAPEQAASDRVGPEADWYSVGVVLYQALAGRLPFAGAPLEVMRKKRQADPEPPSSLCAGVPPDLSSLCMDLLRCDPRARPALAQVLLRLGVADESPQVRSSPSSGQGPPFVGRQEEMRGLEDAFDASQRGAAVAVLVEGESGVGKTALVRRFTDQLEGRGVVVLAGRCYEREAVPYKAVDGVVDALSRYMVRLPGEEAAALLPRTAGLVGDVFPVMRRVRAVAIAPRTHAEARIDPQELRSRLFAAMREIFGRLADRRRLVVVIDDLQWADADSLAMIGEILRPPEPPPLLAIATLRSGVTPALGDLLRFLPGELRRLDLDRLPPQEARELAATLLGRASTSTGVSAETIAVEAEGHPLFIDELVRHAASREGRGSITFRLDEALRERIAELPAPARRVLELVAIAGAPLPQDVMAQAASVAADELTRSIGLLRFGNLVQTAGVGGRETVAPYHDRVREAVAGHLADDVRRAHHADLAVALEQAGRSDPEQLAMHWQGAGDAAKAATHAERAAAAAEAAFAFGHAAELYRAALEARPPDFAGRAELRGRLGAALANAGRGREAAEEFLAAAAGAPPAQALDLQRRAADQFVRSGHIDEGLAAIRRVFDAMGMRLPKTPRRALARLLLRRLQLRLRGLRFRPRRADELPPAALTRLDFCTALSAPLARIDNIRGLELSARALLLALEAGEPGRLVAPVALEAVFLALSGRSPPRNERLLALSADLASRDGRPEARGWLRMATGHVAYYQGRFRKAREDLLEGEEVFAGQCVGAAWETTSCRSARLWAAWWLGRVGEVHRDVPLFVGEARDRSDLYAATDLSLSFHNTAWLVDDQPELAERVRGEAIARWSRQAFHVQHWFDLTAEAHLDLYRGRGAVGHARLNEIWPGLAKAQLLRVQIIRIEAHGLRARCALAGAAAAGGDRPRLLREAERDARRILREQASWASPLAELILAGVAETCGDHEAAARRCAAAAAGFDAADMALYAAAARRRQGQLLGGDDGRGMVAAADAWMAGQKIKNPARWTAMLAPGFPD